MAALAGSDGFLALERLELIGCGCGDDGLIALAQSKGLPALRELVLRGSTHLGPFASNDIGDAGLCALAASPLLSQLTRLDLEENPRIGDAGGKALAGANIPAKLEYLNLSHCPIWPEAAIALGRCPHLVRLRVLGLHGGHIGDTGAKALSRSPHLSRACGKLVISNNNLHARWSPSDPSTLLIWANLSNWRSLAIRSANRTSKR